MKRRLENAKAHRANLLARFDRTSKYSGEWLALRKDLECQSRLISELEETLSNAAGA